MNGTGWSLLSIIEQRGMCGNLCLKPNALVHCGVLLSGTAWLQGLPPRYKCGYRYIDTCTCYFKSYTMYVHVLN
jgi:hypothetical protein